MSGWDGFSKYVGVQGVLVLLLTIALIAMLLLGQVIPGEVYGLLGIAWGFYFGKNGRQIVSEIKHRKESE